MTVSQAALQSQFGIYLQAQQTDRLRRRRLSIATLLAANLSAGALAALWVADALAVSPVRPPKPEFVTLTYSDLQIAAAPPPPARPSSPAPAREPAHEDSEDDTMHEPTPDAAETRPAKPSAPKLGGLLSTTGGVRGVPGIVSSIPSGSTQTGAGSGQELGSASPVDAVMARAIYRPAPSTQQLAQTNTARTSRRKGRVVVHFCVEASGRVSDVQVHDRFPNDSRIDDIVANTVKQWRFRPMTVAGKARRQCDEQVFEIDWK